jgi:type III restriction enzyme
LINLNFINLIILKKYFPHLKSIREFILSDTYLGNVEIEISGPKEKIEKLNPEEKLEIALFVIKKIAEQTKMIMSEYIGTRIFKAKMIRDIFRDKILKIDSR